MDDRIISSRPVNRAAGMQLARGEHWEPQANIIDYFRDMPKIKKPDAATIGSGTFKDFTGQRFGNLVVIGMMDKKSNTRASWICRCVCGGYCSRSAKSLHTASCGGNSFVDRCGRCKYQEGLRDGLFPGMRNYDGSKK